jgi:MFS family permease
MRGRVMSYYTMAFMGTTPFGSLLVGSLASKFGAPASVLLGGVLCVIGGIVFIFKLPAFKKSIHPVYAKKGIIPEIADGIQSAVNLRTPPEN